MTESAPLILVVEDEPALRRDIIEELEEAGYRTLAAADGEAARRLITGITPDLVLCDITMPRLDGYGLLSALRSERPELDATPFVFLTAMSEPQDVIEGKLQGADDYLVKPVDYDLLLATVFTRLQQVSRIRGQHKNEIASLQVALADLSGIDPHPVLDLIALGIVLLDSGSRVLHANRAAKEMSHSGQYFSIRHDTVQAADTGSDKALRRAIADVTAAVPGTETMAGVMLNGRDHSIAALIGTVVGSSPAAGPRIALFLPPPTHAKMVSEKLLIDLFGLTRTEARVAAHLTAGARPSDVAETLGISSTTVSFHMRNLFQKTRTNRQTDLVALILAGQIAVQTP